MKYHFKQLLQVKNILTVCVLSCSINSTFVFAKTESQEFIVSIEKRLANAQALEEKGQLRLALSKTQKLFSENSLHKEVAIAYASQLIKYKNANKAKQVIQPFTKSVPNDWRVWFWLGSAQLLQSDLENASDSLSTALSLNGEEISIWVQKAIVEQEKGNSKASLNLLQVANSLEPNNSAVLINYAYANESEGEINKAVKLYRYFLQLSASDQTKGVLRSEIMLRLVQISSAQSIVNEEIID